MIAGDALELGLERGVGELVGHPRKLLGGHVGARLDPPAGRRGVNLNFHPDCIKLLIP